MKFLSEIDSAAKLKQDADNRLVTDIEKSTWNSKSTLALGETSSTAYAGDKGKIAYDHSQVAHAPSDAQKNSDITKSEIEAKLTGAVLSHTHADDHNHSNKATLDKFTEVGTKPYYNGTEIGEVPNLTLTELTLGSYRIVFNDIENSLDFEVIE